MKCQISMKKLYFISNTNIFLSSWAVTLNWSWLKSFAPWKRCILVLKLPHSQEYLFTNIVTLRIFSFTWNSRMLSISPLSTWGPNFAQNKCLILDPVSVTFTIHWLFLISCHCYYSNLHQPNVLYFHMGFTLVLVFIKLPTDFVTQSLRPTTLFWKLNKVISWNSRVNLQTYPTLIAY